MDNNNFFAHIANNDPTGWDSPWKKLNNFYTRLKKK